MKFVEHAKRDKLVKDFLDRGIISVDSSVEQVERQLKKRGATGEQLEAFAKLVDGYRKSKEKKPVAKIEEEKPVAKIADESEEVKPVAKIVDESEEVKPVAKKTTRRKSAD